MTLKITLMVIIIITTSQKYSCPCAEQNHDAQFSSANDDVSDDPLCDII